MSVKAIGCLESCLGVRVLAVWAVLRLTGLMVFPWGVAALSAQEVANIMMPGYLLRMSYWRESHGLPSWHIQDMVSDRRGMVWLATDVGLVSLDGKRFERHAVHTPGALPQDLRRVALDSRDNLWLFYRLGDTVAVHVYDPRGDRSWTADAYVGRRMSFSRHVLETLFSREGKLWILDPATGCGGYYGDEGAWVEALRDDSTLPGPHTYYFPADGGAFWKLDMHLRWLRKIGADGRELYGCNFTELEHDTNFRLGGGGALYLVRNLRDARGAPVLLMACGEAEGLRPVDTSALPLLDWGRGLAQGFTTLPLRANNRQGVEMIRHLKGLEVWVGGQPRYRDLAGYMEREHRLRLENSLYVMEDGSFWMFAAGALIRLEVLPNYFTRYLSEYTSPMSTRGMAVMGGTLYVNSYQGHLGVDLRSGRSRLLDTGNPYQFGMGMGVWGGKVWRGHHGNVVTEYDPASDRSVWYPVESIYWSDLSGELYFSGGGEVYLGTANGLFRFNRDLGVFRLWELGDRVVYSFHRNAAGVWAGTSKGLALLGEDMRLRRNFTGEIFGEGGALPPVKHLHEDKEGNFWLATDQGLWRWRPFGAGGRRYDVAQWGFPSDRVHGVYEDGQGRLWMPSDGGLICFNKRTERFKTYGSADGLPGSELNWLSHYRDSTGRLYVGGVNGVVSFHPDSIPDEPHGPPRLGLLKVKLWDAFGKSELNLTDAALAGDAIMIPVATDHVIIEFCALDFSGQPTVFRWRIPELDSSWYLLEEPRIDLFHPPYGEYTLEIEARRAGNHLAESVVMRLALEVEKPIRLRWWFIVLSVLTISVLVASFFLWRQRQLKWRGRQLALEVQEKTAELQVERDVIARQAEELRRLDEEKSRFFQDLSHEIRNPLTLILGPVSELLKREELPELYREKLERVKRNTRKIMALIEEVLELTRLEAGVVPLEHSEFVVEVFLDRLVGEFELRAGAEGKALRLAHHFPDGLMIRTDRRKLEKVISNLIDNALKYTPSGGAVLVQAWWQEEGVLRVEVRDTGVGIAGEHLGRIFDRYYQVPGVEALGRKSGFGIGLAMCRSYMQLLGGEITAESTPGAGTAMRLVLPCGEVKSAVVMKELGRTEPAGRRGRILVVDDEPEILDYVASLLSDRHEVIRAGSGEEAWSILAREKFELVISDLVMPEGGGLELLSRIRGDGINQATPFLMLTGFHTGETLLEAARLGCNGHLSKPVEEEEFFLLVNELLQSRIAE